MSTSTPVNQRDLVTLDPAQLDKLVDAKHASLWGYLVYGVPALITKNILSTHPLDAPSHQQVCRALLKWLDAKLKLTACSCLCIVKINYTTSEVIVSKCSLLSKLDDLDVTS